MLTCVCVLCVGCVNCLLAGFCVQLLALLCQCLFVPPPPPPQILWTFSIYLESVAVMPQLYMISKTGEAETITSHYLFALGTYRALYIVNWVYRYLMEDFYDWIAIVAGIVQTLLYCDFFYLYITKGEGASMVPGALKLCLAACSP